MSVSDAVVERLEADVRYLRDALERNMDRADRAEEALREISGQQSETMGWFRANGIVFDGPLGVDPKNWEHVAFSIYTDLCRVDMIARNALEGENG